MMIRSLWKKVCKDQGVTPKWEYDECVRKIEEVDIKIENSVNFIHELKKKMISDGEKIGSKNYVCIRTKNNILRHENNLINFKLEKENLMNELENMKLDF